MINRVQSNTTFGSTSIKLLPAERNQGASKVLSKYLSEVKDSYGVMKAGLQGKNVTPQMVADDIVNGKFACTITCSDKDIFINTFGKDKKTDSAIGKMLTKMFPNAKFVNDIK